MHLKSLLLNKLFSNFKLQKYGRILVGCVKKRAEINENIADIVLLFLTYSIQLNHYLSFASCYHCTGLFYSKWLCLLIKKCNLRNEDEIVNPCIKHFFLYSYSVLLWQVLLILRQSFCIYFLYDHQTNNKAVIFVPTCPALI